MTVQAPVLDDGSVDFQFELPHAEPTPAKQQGVTARWVGQEPLSIRCTADPDRVAKALGDGEEIVMKTVELPVAAESKTGKEIVRAPNGSIQAAIDTEFVELRWDLDRARRQGAAA